MKQRRPEALAGAEGEREGLRGLRGGGEGFCQPLLREDTHLQTPNSGCYVGDPGPEETQEKLRFPAQGNACVLTHTHA